MEEEIGITPSAAPTVLGVLKCNWGEVRMCSYCSINATSNTLLCYDR
jgi:hypothetical protein